MGNVDTLPRKEDDVNVSSPVGRENVTSRLSSHCGVRCDLATV